MTKQELVQIIKDNFTNKQGVVDISEMDFGECSVDISSLKTGKSLWQHSQDVNKHLYQNAQKVGQDLFQDSQKVFRRSSCLHAFLNYFQIERPDLDIILLLRLWGSHILSQTFSSSP